MIRPLDRVPPELRDTCAMLAAAYPSGVPDEDYGAVLFLLSENMSIRALARVMAACSPRRYEAVYNDVLGVQAWFADTKLPAAAVQHVRQKLGKHGYEEWLKLK